MVESITLQAIFNRVEAGKRLSRQELQTLMTAARSGQVAIAMGDHAVAIGGSADGAVIVTGDRNIVITGADAEAIRELMGKRPRNEELLLKTVKDEVAARLEKSLHNAVLIQLEMGTQPEQVKPPWGSNIIIGNLPTVPLPPEIKTLQVFERTEIAGRLLILGEPGSGKTTTLLDLAQALIQKAEQDPTYPIPVLFDLSSWQEPRQEMKDWLVLELKSKYKLRADVSTKWIEEKQLLPLLDGLDEVKPEHQISCLRAINLLLQGEYCPSYLVVCCRWVEYRNYQELLHLNGAILLKDLTDAQIQDYLTGLERAEFWHILQADPALLELVRKPLMLAVTILSYKELPLEQWQRVTSKKVRLELLWDAYVLRMMQRSIRNEIDAKCKHLTDSQTRQWLIWLANQMQREFLTEFAIEALQPLWLTTSAHMWSYRLSVGLIIGLIVGLSIGPTESLYATLGVMTTFLTNFTSPLITPIDSLKWSWKGARSYSFFLLVIGLGIMVIFGLSFWLFTGLNTAGLYAGLFFGLVVTPIGVLIGALYGGLTGKAIERQISRISKPISYHSEIEPKVFPNESIWKSAVNGVIFFLIGWIFAELINALLNQPLVGLFSGWSIGVMFALYGGGGACIQHFALRFILYCNGYIPWNYACFLDYCTERRFLQRVGGRYRFIHRLLQEHFAAMSLERVGSRE